jgi:hypothetical protein
MVAIHDAFPRNNFTTTLVSDQNLNSLSSIKDFMQNLSKYNLHSSSDSMNAEEDFLLTVTELVYTRF